MSYLSTSADLLQRAYRFLRETSASPTVWTSAQVMDYLDEGHAYVCADFNYLAGTWVVTTSASPVTGYPVSASMIAIRSVWIKRDAGDTDYVRLRRANVQDTINMGLSPNASGKSSHWTMDDQGAGTVIVPYPIPDTSVASGLLVKGIRSPETLASSMSPLPRHLVFLVPIQAALLAWSDLGASPEIARLAQLYESRAKRWRTISVDLSPDETNSETWGTADDDTPYSLIRRVGAPLPNPLQL